MRVARLAARIAEVQAGERKPSIRPAMSSQFSHRVLLAEDNPVNQRLAVRLLEKLGHRADVVSNGAAALEALEATAYDLVLMDCQMPEVDGFEATRAIRQWESTSRVGSSPASRLPIVALTANAMQGDRERCLAAGMDDYITKPLARSDLARVLENSPSFPRSSSSFPRKRESSNFLDSRLRESDGG